MYPFRQDARPNGGWSWKVHGRTFLDEHLGGLLGQVREFRRQTLRPAGDVTEEYRAWAWGRHPEIFDTSQPPVPKKQNPRLTTFVHTHLLRTKAMPILPAKKDVIDARFKVCQECQFWQESLTSTGEAKDAAIRLEVLLNHQRKEFGYCALYGVSLSVSLCTTNPAETSSREPKNPPPNCPMRGQTESSQPTSGGSSRPSGPGSSSTASIPGTLDVSKLPRLS